MFEVSKYDAWELRSVMRDDPWAVRGEAYKRHCAMIVKIAAAKKKLAKMEVEAAEMGSIIEATFRAI